MKTAHIFYFLCALFVTTHTIAGGDINNEFAITAYDSSIDGTDDMVDGNESWYSKANTLPELPTNIVLEGAPRKSKLSWTLSASDNVSGYKIFRGTDTRTLPIIVQSNPLVIVDGSLGVTQMLYTGEISLYPNPASDQINIVCPEQLEFIKVELYNINGQYLGSNNFKNMSVSQLQGGVYFLKIYTKQGAFIKKII